MRRSFYFNRKKRTELEERITQLDTSIRTVTGDISTVRSEWQEILSGTQKITKTIRTRRDAGGQLVADVFEGKGDGTRTELEERVAALETLPRLAYRGVWEQRQYNEADLVTHDGSMFHCNCSTRAKPGTNSDWVLCVKRGRDAKTR
jgi:hypothetical protein